ncbi:flavin reductase family protein [Nocardia sp. NPDC049190]|uniref:flavin reductase family protein n=1 Tax=Nocardia sp. NPDC049190 TaxID=3155650 RepID=UPI0033CC08E7
MQLRAVDLDRTGFRSALGRFASSVNVISMWDEEGGPIGMTATAFSSVSDDPLLVLICVNRATRTYGHITRGGRFGVNILGSAAVSISNHCARPGSDKGLAPEWLATDAGWSSPALKDALAFLDCTVDSDTSAGTHAILVGRVTGVGIATHGEPLLYFGGRYQQLRPEVQYRSPLPLPIAWDGGDPAVLAAVAS